MSDENERSVASDGSVGGEHELPGVPLYSERFKMAHAAWEWCAKNGASVSAPVNIVTALFSLGLVVKKPTLTDAEREAIEAAIDRFRDWVNGTDDEEREVALRSLLERMK